MTETDKKLKFLWFGGDYNPDQFDEATLKRDIESFKKAHINLVILPVFSWAKLEPSEGVYRFEWLDRILSLLEEAKIYVCLANATAAQPAWMSKKYPEIMPIDRAGRKRNHGMRMFYCVNSEKFRERARALTEQFALRYKDYKGLVGWHVANEYGTMCYCENCQKKFRLWLEKRYKTLENLNEKWNTAFWGRELTSFDEVMLPTELNDDYRFAPAIALDYKRFMTDSTKECYLNEAEVLKKYTPDLPIFSNISGHIENLDQFSLTEVMDFAGWDNYPYPNQPYSIAAMKLDLMRGLKNQKPFLIAEQSPNQQNWQPYNKLKRPGELRTLAYQGLAHGGESCLYFQLRQSIAGQEKLHGAIISHADTEDTRIFREIKALGDEFFKTQEAYLNGTTDSEVAFLFDWDNWWSLELCSGPTKDMDYLRELHHYYSVFYKKNISVDFVRPDRDFGRYKVIMAPLYYMVKEGVSERLSDFVKKGGTLVATYMTGLVDENDRCVYGAYPGKLRDIFGLWVEETDALYKEEKQRLTADKKEYSASFLCDLIHLEGAKGLAFYDSDFYSGMPAVTVNTYGDGKAYYLATKPDEDYLTLLFERILHDKKIDAPLAASGEVEVRVRKKKGKEVIFVINHSEDEGSLSLGDAKYTDLLTGSILSGEKSLTGREVLLLATAR